MSLSLSLSLSLDPLPLEPVVAGSKDKAAGLAAPGRTGSAGRPRNPMLGPALRPDTNARVVATPSATLTVPAASSINSKLNLATGRRVGEAVVGASDGRDVTGVNRGRGSRFQLVRPSLGCAGAGEVGGRCGVGRR